MTLHHAYRTPEMAARLSLARSDIRRARMFFDVVTFSGWQYGQDAIDGMIDAAHDCRRDARRHLAVVLRNDRLVRAALYQDLACDAYRHADQLRTLPAAHAVMVQQAAYYASTARETMGVAA